VAGGLYNDTHLYRLNCHDGRYNYFGGISDTTDMLHRDAVQLQYPRGTGGRHDGHADHLAGSTQDGEPRWPPSFLFGFSGSPGGETNIHEIMCFKAAAATTSGSSATVNQVQSAKVEAGTQAFFAFYNPNVWTGTVTANGLADNMGVVTVNSQANWDAQCMLTGTSSGALTAGG